MRRSADCSVAGRAQSSAVRSGVPAAIYTNVTNDTNIDMNIIGIRTGTASAANPGRPLTAVELTDPGEVSFLYLVATWDEADLDVTQSQRHRVVDN